MSFKELILFSAHIDDIEFSCLGFLLNHVDEYDKIKIITATSWKEKVGVFAKNFSEIQKKIKKRYNLY